jgi:two-component system sensor histidine kinase KdpD
MNGSATSPRAIVGFTVGVIGVVVLALGLAPLHAHISRAVPALVLVLPVIVSAILGGVIAAVAVAVVAATALSLAFIPPVGTLEIDLPEDIVAFVLFVLVAIIAAVLVGREVDRRRAAEARRADVLEHVDRQRAAMLRAVSHDLRTPLSIIRAAASELRAEPGHDEQTRAELLDLVNNEAQRLDRIVANILSLGRIEAGALSPNLEAVDLVELIEHAAARLQPLFGAHTLRLELPRGLPLVRADYSQIDQVVTNILENAVRHTPAGTTVVVIAAATSDSVVVSVCDDGDGIDPALWASLFEPFRSASRATTGIGLAICAAIVDAHRGTLTAGESARGGAAFQFSLPIDG